MRTLFVLGIVFGSLSLFASEQSETVFDLELQGGVVWQSRNDYRVPNPNGTLVGLDQFERGPFSSQRVYLGVHLSPKHHLRLLWAPLSLGITHGSANPVNFNGTVFAAGKTLTTTYVFNSYRLTYYYENEFESSLKYRIGFTAKIRDALVRVANEDVFSEYPNVGFVPLLHLGLNYRWNDNWQADVDLDGLAAPQGRAFDLALKVSYGKAERRISLGFRTLEGGADNDKVFTFSWFHTLFLGVTLGF